MNVIVSGCGRLGAQLGMLLDSEGYTITIIDSDIINFNRLEPDFRGTALIGDGTEEDFLRKAGIEQADVFVAVTESDNYNIMSAQLVKHIFNVPKVVCRIYDPHKSELYETLGLDVLSSTCILAQVLKEKVTK